MLYEIHMLKNYPPVNLNRDDTGSPKTCYFGGVQRGRISSQCLKRSWRKSDLYEQLLGECGIRTEYLPRRLEAELNKKGYDDKAFIEEAKRKACSMMIKEEPNSNEKDSKDQRDKKQGKKDDFNKTAQTIFYSPEDIEVIAQVMINLYNDNGKSIKAFQDIKKDELMKHFDDAKTRSITLDIAMFGRMVTSSALRNVEAAVQVAHAISTHEVKQESDYYTAVDDLLAENEESGASMIGDIDFNACCYYHYASINTDLLHENLKGECNDLDNTLLPALIRIMAYTNPSGKQNSFAGHILPSLICVEIKEDKIPVSYANAYATPIYARKNSVVEKSVSNLRDEINKIDRAFGLKTKRLWFSPDNYEGPEKAIKCNTIQELCEKLTSVESKW